jgi:iron complex outermembrane recepter protein
MLKISMQAGGAMGLCALLSAASAGAQDSLQISPLEEVLVTAQKREENLQDVPISISALTSDYLAENNIGSIQDLAGSVPGLVVTNTLSHGTAPISIRGIGGPNGGGSIFNDEPVAIYVDGVYVARLGASVMDLVDIDSVQVLRGPQGTLYGRNSTAGALLLTSKRPTSSFESDLRLGYAQYDQSRVSAAVSGPLGTNFVLGRLAIGYSDGGDFAENLADGRDVGGARNKMARGSLRFLPTDSLTIDVIGDYQEQTSHPALFTVAALSPTAPPTFPFAGPIYAGNPFVPRADLESAIEDDRIALGDETVTRIESRNGTMLLDWDLGAVKLASITGYRWITNDGRQDSDASPDAVTFAGSTGALQLLRNYGEQEHSEYTQELRLQSAEEGRVKWIAGLYFIREDNQFDFTIESFQSGPPQPGVPPQRPAGTLATFLATQDLQAYAAFFDVSWAFTDALTLSVGGRYSDEKKQVDINQSVVNRMTGANLAAPLSFTGEDSWSDFSPRGVIEYEINADTMLYGSYSRGFKSGGYNSFDATPVAAAFAQEEIDAYEVGVKTDVLDGRLRMNASAFNYDYRNVQIRQAVFTGGVSVRTVPEAQVRGVEFETTFAPVDQLLVRASVSYLDAELKKGTLQALPSNIGSIRYGAQLFPPPNVFPVEDVAGNRMTRAPEWQYYLYGEYTWPMQAHALRLSTTWRSQSSVFFSETNQDTRSFIGAGWDELDVRLGLSDADERWEIALFGRNVLDERHVTQVAPFNGFPVASVNMPAQFGAQLSYKIR